jgi:hypothetical protein
VSAQRILVRPLAAVDPAPHVEVFKPHQVVEECAPWPIAAGRDVLRADAFALFSPLACPAITPTRIWTAVNAKKRVQATSGASVTLVW